MSSEYILPFDPQRYGIKITEGRNGPWGHQLVEKAISTPGHFLKKDLRNAIDFALPLGAEIIASRGGLVIAVINTTDDFYEGDDQQQGVWGKANFVAIHHEDGTTAFYSHLRKGGVFVKVGQRVNRGRALAVVGKTGWQRGGSTVHFQVNDTHHPGVMTTPTLPVEFSNYSGPLEHSEIIGLSV